MRFFERQREHKQTTAGLLFVFVLLVFILNILFAFSSNTFLQYYEQFRYGTHHLKNVGLRPVLMLGTFLSFIFFVYAWFCYLSLKREKGSDFAASIGAVPVREFFNDANVAQLVRCVAEMSIAARVRTPRVFVLPESGINAMVAGCNVHSLALIVTRGAIDLLDKQELQGVIGHEFSHLYHQDVSLGLKLLACVKTLNGVFNVGLNLTFGNPDDDRQKKNFLVGALLIVFGYLGHLAANILRSRIMREREFLADASAVQYSRHTSGLISAFCKVAHIKHKNKKDIYLHGCGYDTVAHLFILPVYQRLDKGWFATHPPLFERISRLREL